ncbi:MAG: YtxH domain-containing protein [Anaerolineae bacterium]
MRKTLSFLGGLMLGLVTGGGLGLLLAPSSGPELQEQIQEYVEHLIEEGQTAAEARRLEMEAQLEAFKQGRPLSGSSPEVE